MLPIDELRLLPEESAIIERVFSAGKMHPWSDELTYDVMDWMDRIVRCYLESRRNSTAVGAFIVQFQGFLDRIILERLETLRLATEDVHDHPPYCTADRWPLAEFSVVKRVVDWAFGNTEMQRTDQSDQ